MSGVLVNVLDATGRVKTTLKLMVLWTILTWILTPAAIYLWGYNGVAIASFMVTLTIGVTVYLVKKVVQFDFIKSIYKPIFATLIMAIFNYGLSLLILNSLISLFFVIILGGLVYLSLIYLIAGRVIAGDIKKLIS